MKKQTENNIKNVSIDFTFPKKHLNYESRRNRAAAKAQHDLPDKTTSPIATDEEINKNETVGPKIRIEQLQKEKIETNTSFDAELDKNLNNNPYTTAPTNF